MAHIIRLSLKIGSNALLKYMVLSRYVVSYHEDLQSLQSQWDTCSVPVQYPIFYQAQTTEFVVPDEEADFYIKAYIGSAFALKFIDLVQLIFTQCSVDIFFVDWEREVEAPGKKKKKRPLPARTEADTYMNSRGEPVSVWRRLLVTNEWTEIQVGFPSASRYNLINDYTMQHCVQFKCSSYSIPICVTNLISCIILGQCKD